MTAGLFKKDNRGSALVAVIIAMLFLGIIASIVIAISHSTLMNSRVGENSKKNFYEDEVALDEFKSKLKDKADEAVKEAYERWLREYTKLGSELEGDALKAKFNEIFAEVFRNKIKEYFQVTYIDTDGSIKTTPLSDITSDYKTLLDSTVRPTIDMRDPKNIRIVGITVTEINGDNITTITTDMLLRIAPPTVRVGSHIGADTKLADYALISDNKIVLTDGTNISIKGNVYAENEIEVKGSGTTKVALHSDAIVSRNTLSTNNGAEVTIDGNVSEYSNVWVDNIVMQRGKKSSLDIKGICNVYDDLTIDGDGSVFKLSGTESEYHGYSTSSEPKDSSNNASIVVNGKNVSLNLTNAKRLWLFGKNYVSVPEKYGDPDGAHASFMLGESVSFRSLQAAYLLPGECIVGIGHNPMSEEDFDDFQARYKAHSLNGTMNTALKEAEADQVFNLGVSTVSSVKLDSYLNKTQPAYWAFAEYYDGTVLWYLYMNFKDPGMAAEYFQVYSNNLKNDIMKSRLGLANAEGEKASFSIPTTNSSVDDSGLSILDSEEKSGSNRVNWKVVNTGNILSYNGSDYTLYGKNADYTDTFVFNQSDTLLTQFDNIKTTLNTSSPGETSVHTTKTLGVNFENIDENAYVAAVEGTNKKTTYSVQRITQKDAENNDVPVEITVDGIHRYDAYMIAVSGTEGGSLYIDSNGYLYYGDHAADSLRACDKNGTELKDAMGNRLSVKAGIIVVKGDVYLASAEFLGTVIASNNIYVKGNNSSVKVAFSVVKQLLQTNEIVMPYFSIDDENKDGPIDFSNLIGLDFDNWRKD